ncbi:unnamed protein product [Menidia menidia]|uniref:(Atlantic silverside) hypothetical protein n=1 Tax=Menidia menidia TaxID=238744 RepID=A0A8S4AJR7_9TELE|nr:unnamed protein product [Menidia menidia]
MCVCLPEKGNGTGTWTGTALSGIAPQSQPRPCLDLRAAPGEETVKRSCKRAALETPCRSSACGGGGRTEDDQQTGHPGHHHRGMRRIRRPDTAELTPEIYIFLL